MAGGQAVHADPHDGEVDVIWQGISHQRGCYSEGAIGGGQGGDALRYLRQRIEVSEFRKAVNAGVDEAAQPFSQLRLCKEQPSAEHHHIGILVLENWSRLGAVEPASLCARRV